MPRLPRSPSIPRRERAGREGRRGEGRVEERREDFQRDGAAFHFTNARRGESGIVCFYQIKLMDSEMRITNWSYKSSDLLTDF